MEKSNNSVSNLLDKEYGTRLYSRGGMRGKILHEVLSRYLKRVFKTADRSNKVNQRVFSQRLTKEKSDILADNRKNPQSELFQEDIKVLLNVIHKEIRSVSKESAKDNYGIIIPEEIESIIFGGEFWIEEQVLGKIGGFNIPARVDFLIEADSERFMVRDFKSYARDTEDDPLNPESDNHRDFMQVSLYATIFEKERSQICKVIQLHYFPFDIVSYKFTDDLREAARQFARNTAFEGFEGISFDFPVINSNDDEEGSLGNITSSSALGLPPDVPSTIQNRSLLSEDDEVLGYINTIKEKPLELVMGKDNRMDGFLYSNKARLVRDGYCVIVEKEEDGVRIMSMVKKIQCSKDKYHGETSSHVEENYKITLNPEGQFTPEGYKDLRPQTIIGGKIKRPTDWEYCEYRKIPQNGMLLGHIQGLNAGIPYPIGMKALYQSTFMSGQQDSGKTSGLKYLIMQTNQQEECPAQVILDNEDEYGNLGTMPSNECSKKMMEKHGIETLAPDKFNTIKISLKEGYCLTLKAIDPIDLPTFLHELTAVSHDTLQSIIYDILEDYDKKDFTLPELSKLIFKYIEKEKYGAAPSTKSAIQRAMTSISLKLFDVPGATPIDVESMLTPGIITIINTYNLRDSQQRIVGLYLLAILHKRALKGKKKLKVLLYLDEIQRLLPKARSQADSEYLKRIITFLDEIVHRGRKRDYGVIFATQSVMDVKKDIIDLCNTKIFMQTQGSGTSYLKEYFANKEDLERLKKLPQGHGFITSKGRHDPVEIKFPYID